MTSYAGTNAGLVLSAFFAVTVLGGVASGQEAQRDQSPPSTGPTASATNQRDMGSMMAERKKMMADMKASEKKLDELVAKMNASRGADKIDLMAAVINDLIALHKTMHQGMMSEGGMMQQMRTGPQLKENDPKPAGPDTPSGDHQQHH